MMTIVTAGVTVSLISIVTHASNDGNTLLARFTQSGLAGLLSGRANPQRDPPRKESIDAPYANWA